MSSDFDFKNFILSSKVLRTQRPRAEPTDKTSFCVGSYPTIHNIKVRLPKRHPDFNSEKVGFVSWSLAINGSAVIFFINSIYYENKPSPSACSRNPRYRWIKTLTLSILKSGYQKGIRTLIRKRWDLNPRCR